MAAGPHCNIHERILPLANDTGFTPPFFILIGIPGLEDFHIWFAAPLSGIYVITLFGNLVLMLAIKTVLSLHRPMYLLISQLSFSDLVLSSAVLPKMVDIFWFNAGEIRFSACLTQMFFVQSSSVLQSSILSTMAFDRYVAICQPLRYSSIFTNELVAKIAMASLARTIIFVAPLQLITMMLPFCNRYIAHSYCENMAVAKLSCSKITVNSVYVLVLSILFAVDILSIALSYCLIIRAVLRLSNTEERFKAFSTCSSHICVLLSSYGPALFSVIMHRLNHDFPTYVHIIVANISLIFPPLINPLMYGMTMKEIRKGMQQLIHRMKLKPSV